MDNAERHIDMILSLDDEGNAHMKYVDLESGEDFDYKFHFTGELGDDRNSQMFTIGAEIMSWFDILKELLDF